MVSRGIHKSVLWSRLLCCSQARIKALAGRLNSMMAESPSNYMVRNGLIFAFRALRQGERLVGESLRSPYEQFFMDVAAALFPNKKMELGIVNSEVEKFYNKHMTETEFMINVQTKLLSKMAGGQGSGGPPSSPTGSNGVLSTVRNGFSQHALLFSVVWGLLVTQNKAVFSKLPNLSGKQLWEIFIKLDTGECACVSLCAGACVCILYGHISLVTDRTLFM